MPEDMPRPLVAEPAIRFDDVHKVYRLYASVSDQAVDVLGLSALFFWRRGRYREFSALSGVNLTVARGERLGVLGRNGAGKSTLLKLITGNFRPTGGTVTINGRVQALMSVGLGFHPEFSGYENIRSSLLYNGL
jgi:lipopolysaccharide transport system ATP-binding protein